MYHDIHPVLTIILNSFIIVLSYLSNRGKIFSVALNFEIDHDLKSTMRDFFLWRTYLTVKAQISFEEFPFDLSQRKRIRRKSGGRK